MMQAMPQDVVDKANTAARLEGPAKYGKDVDLDSQTMKAFTRNWSRTTPSSTRPSPYWNR
jgi:hypothetical protein